jgi:hypothetical protein
LHARGGHSDPGGDPLPARRGNARQVDFRNIDRYQSHGPAASIHLDVRFVSCRSGDRLGIRALETDHAPAHQVRRLEALGLRSVDDQDGLAHRELLRPGIAAGARPGRCRAGRGLGRRGRADESE